MMAAAKVNMNSACAILDNEFEAAARKTRCIAAAPLKTKKTA
jgi:hypothetical protein